MLVNKSRVPEGWIDVGWWKVGCEEWSLVRDQISLHHDDDDEINVHSPFKLPWIWKRMNCVSIYSKGNEGSILDQTSFQTPPFLSSRNLIAMINLPLSVQERVMIQQWIASSAHNKALNSSSSSQSSPPFRTSKSGWLETWRRVVWC